MATQRMLVTGGSGKVGHWVVKHLLEEGYSEHEAYILIAGGEIMAHIQAIRDEKAKS